MARTIGKAEFYSLSCTLDKCDDIEGIIEHQDEITEAYKSEWSIDNDGDIVVEYAYKATRDGFNGFSKTLDSEKYYDLVKEMELIKF